MRIIFFLLSCVFCYVWSLKIAEALPEIVFITMAPDTSSAHFQRAKWTYAHTQTHTHR